MFRLKRKGNTLREDQPGDVVISQGGQIYEVYPDRSRRRVRDKERVAEYVKRFEEMKAEAAFKKQMEENPITAVKPEVIMNTLEKLATGESLLA